MARILSICMLMIMFTLKGKTQNRSFHNIQEAIDYHIAELKEGNWNNLKRIYISGALDSVSTTENVLVIQNSINPKYLKKDETNLLIRVMINPKSSKTALTILNFNVKKKSRRHLYLINLGSGGKYIIE